MALRKITDLGKEEYSKPANTVFHNTDADDIVDSAKSVNQAKELSRVIDALLKVGSFFLKGCLWWSLTVAFYSIHSIQKDCKLGMTFNFLTAFQSAKA